MNISKLMIGNALRQKAERKWSKIYWAIDLHDTVITGTYNKFNRGSQVFPYAKEVLDFLYHHPEHQTILWSSSYDESLNDIIARFNLRFNYINCNPEVDSDEICCFHKKFYFNILLDDKAGFDGNTGWLDIRDELILQKIWKTVEFD